MRRVLVATLLMGLSAVAISAQSNEQKSTNDFVFVLPGPTCPVRMHALQGSGTGLVAVRDAKPSDGPSQRIHLMLSNENAAKVTGARVTVLGTSGKSRLENALSSREGTSNLTRSLEVAFAPEGERDVATDLVLPGFTSVSSIQLESITYQDGTTWRVAGRRACHVAPDPMMLVADR
jgi:hypothetical protein